MREEHYRPKVLVTMGDPAGIGPEICACCMVDKKIHQATRTVLIGDEVMLRKGLEIRGIHDYKINRIECPEEGVFEEGIINLIQPYQDCDEIIPFGHMNMRGAEMAYSYIVSAIETAKSGSVDLIATAPINKESFHLAGMPEKDHTNLFKSHYKDSNTVSMFHCKELCVFHYTRHMSLKNAIEALNVEKLVSTMEGINRILKSFGITNPSIAIAALNPHASDDGMFGDEEELYLKPAIEQCLVKGIQAVGPVPADSVFYLQKQGMYDGILSLFHDQGHIACKTYDFEKSVSLTFGLPFMRSTVDHGTAYDLAGKGTASYENLKEAILVGADYCLKHKKIHK